MGDVPGGEVGGRPGDVGDGERRGVGRDHGPRLRGRVERRVGDGDLAPRHAQGTQAQRRSCNTRRKVKARAETTPHWGQGAHTATQSNREAS